MIGTLAVDVTFRTVRRGLSGRVRSPPRPLLAVGLPNVIAHPSTASVPITVLLCGFNMGNRGLTHARRQTILESKLR